MSTRKDNERFVEIKPDMLKYVLGRDRSNLKTLQNKYPTLRIYSTRGQKKTGIMVEGEFVNQVDSCIRDINTFVMSAYAYRDNNLKKKKINKEKLAKKKSIQAINKIKENIKRETEEKELMEREIETAKKEGREFVDLKKKREEKIIKEKLKYNYFYALTVHE